jgi:TonB family protein
VEVVQSADPDFDAAAVRVARLLRFKPAYVNGQTVAVKMRQAIRFKLER